MSLDKKCKWFFSEWNKSMTLYGPNDAIVQSFNHDFYDSLVRESIQNSMDAVLDKSHPVLVEFKLSRIAKKSYPELFQIEQHIIGCRDSFADQRAKDLYDPMLDVIHYNYPPSLDLIRVSDYNTTGMTYDYDNPKNPFSAFTKSVGFSLKPSKSSGGSFGFGKAAYYQMSPLRTILVSTMDVDGNTYFEGVSRLSTHEVDGKQYCEVGYYDCHQGEPSKGTEIPDEFIRKSKGTDIILLGRFMDSGSVDTMESELVKSVLINFWMAIYSRKLVVNVGKYRISDAELPDLIAKYFPVTSKHKSNPRPYFDAFTSKPDKDHLKYSRRLSTVGEVSFYVVKDPNAKRTRVAYMRKPMMLVETKVAPACNGMYGLFICMDEHGNEILSNIEDASHSSWSTKGKTGKAYSDADKVLQDIWSFIDDCFQEIYDDNDVVEYFDIGIGSTENDLEGLLQDKSTLYNPFNSVDTGVSDMPDGSKLVNKLRRADLTEQSEGKDGNIGASATGKRNSDSAVVQTIGSGHNNPKSKTKGGKPVSGKDRTPSRPEEETGEDMFSLFSPTDFRVAAEYINGEWVHTLILHVDEELDHAFIEISIGSEDGEEKASLSSTSVGRIGNGKGIINFDHLSEGTARIKIRFTDNMRHAIKLK